MRALHNHEIISACDRVESWGYPRALEDEDRNGLWFSVEREGSAAGYSWYCEFRLGQFAMHAAIAPEWRRKLCVRDHLTKAMAYIKAIGGRELWVVDAFGVAAIRLARLSRLGWRDLGGGIFRLEL